MKVSNLRKNLKKKRDKLLMNKMKEKLIKNNVNKCLLE
jgi:hypothetical protein